MNKSHLMCAFITSMILISPPRIFASTIFQVDYFSLNVSDLIDFENIPTTGALATNFDDIISVFGASFAERFIGQTLSFAGNADVLSGSPDSNLSLQTGASYRNLVLVEEFPDKELAGVGPDGPTLTGIGEGSIAVLFDIDQSEFGFYTRGGDLGTQTIEFWRRDGSLIDMISPTALTEDYFGFRRENGIQDIAGISIWNTDPGGLIYDDFIFSITGEVNAVVPIPASAWLFSTGLLVLIGTAIRKNT